MLHFADLHFHSKYSRAVSPLMELDGLNAGAKLKGLAILGTGDFTHPLWFEELKERLVKDEGAPGFYRLSKESVRFMLTCEVSTIVSTQSGVKKVHHILHAPSLEQAAQVNDLLSRRGNLSADGRPTFGKTSPAELVELLRSVSKDVVVVPAHCVVPGTFVHTWSGVNKIEDMRVGETTLTHSGAFRRVTGVFERDYDGQVLEITPFYFREGIRVTPEHPFYAIKTKKRCSWTNGVCRPSCSETAGCRSRHYLRYSPSWVFAEKLEVGDVLLYPRVAETKDIALVDASEYMSSVPVGRSKRLPGKIQLDGDFCRLIGYYLAEGYLTDKNALMFTFAENETEYVDDVVSLAKGRFGITPKRVFKEKGGALTVLFYSKQLCEFFRNFCYPCGAACRAWTKRVPAFMLSIALEKQAELFRGWWRGDSGYTVSRQLANQMKLICLRLGIIPSIAFDKRESFEARGNHLLCGRRIVAGHDCIVFSHLSFFEDPFGLRSDACFRKFISKRPTKHGWMDERFVYLPIRRIRSMDYRGKVYNLEVDEENSFVTEFAAVHNCWTPWFSVFGSKSGFDSLEEGYGDQAKHIFAIESGLSSDPAMNWRVSGLDRYSIVSNSDSHSPYPWRLGRECNAFEFGEGELSYKALWDSVRKKDKRNFKFTIETPPAYGKYHWDGHRSCGFSCAPSETRKLGGICPKCGKPLTIGVENRVEELADRPDGFVPEGAVPFRTLLPLHELLSAVYGKALTTNAVAETADRLILAAGSELSVLLGMDEAAVAKLAGQGVASAVASNRSGAIKVAPGFDGEYGRPEL